MVLANASCTRWLGVHQPEAPGRSLIITAEDTTDEIRHRIYDNARAHGIATIPDGSIDIIDIHDVHMPLLDSECQPTEHASALIDLVGSRGPYSLVIPDPIARISGASIDGDNRAACALVTVFERVASAARGFVLGAHHTSQTARRTGITDATASRGATGLVDSARLVMVMTVENVDVSDTPQWSDLGEIITVTRAKANHVRRWEPVQLRRDEHGALLPLDGGAREIVARAKAAADPDKRKEFAREKRTAERQAREDAAVLDAVRSSPGIVTRDLRARVSTALSVRPTTAGEAIDRSVASGTVRREPAGQSQRHYPGGGS
jgi:RecA-family ATPase